MTIDEEKQQLRATIRRLSAQLPFRYREAADRAIARHLLALPEYRSAGAVFCFVSAGREIDTRPILEQTLADGKMLCVPLCVADGIMELRAIRDLKELFPGAYGILEPPADSPALSPDQIDLAVIPCVTCSREGRRLGRGGGYYDRFLAHYRGAAVLLCRERTLISWKRLIFSGRPDHTKEDPCNDPGHHGLSLPGRPRGGGIYSEGIRPGAAQH